MANRNLEVGAHSHGKFAYPVAPGESGEEREMRTRGLVIGWDSHQAFNGQSEFGAALFDEGVSLLRQNTGLLRLCSGVDLDIKPRGFSLSQHRIRKGARQARAIKGFNNAEEGHGGNDLIGLERPYKTQLDLCWGVPPPGRGLLNPIFAEDRLSGRQNGFDGRPWLLLGYSRQSDGARRAPGRAGGSVDPGADLGQASQRQFLRRVH